MRASGESTSGLIRGGEWSLGTSPCGVKPYGNVACRSVSPRIAPLRLFGSLLEGRRRSG